MTLGEPVMHKGLVGGDGALSHWGELLEDGLNGHTVPIMSGPVKPVAAPRIGFRSVRQASTDGIQMNVAYQFEQIGVRVTENRLVSPLKAVADRMMARVEVLREALLKALHGLGERKSLGRNDQVQVVRHQNVGIKGESVSLPVPSKQFGVPPVVCFVSKDMAPLVSTGDDVVEGAWNIDAGRPSHAVSPKRTPWKAKEHLSKAYQWVMEIASYQGLTPGQTHLIRS